MFTHTVLAFLNFGVTEGIIIALVVLLLFGPKAARSMGKIGRTFLDLKKDVDGVKSGVKKQIARQVKDVVIGPADEKPPEKPSEKS